ncbi:MAG: hypothetical protein ACFFBD_26150 [Candidatus Hodarchaeota archaeon]
MRTIQIIDQANAWDYRIHSKEHNVRETFYHAIQAIFEDAGNWFLNDPTRFQPSSNPREDLSRAINRMIEAIKDFQDEDLSNEFQFQWGEQTTIAEAIRQNLFHAVGHFSQLRNWVGLSQRYEKL